MWPEVIISDLLISVRHDDRTCEIPQFVASQSGCYIALMGKFKGCNIEEILFDQ